MKTAVFLFINNNLRLSFKKRYTVLCVLCARLECKLNMHVIICNKNGGYLKRSKSTHVTVKEQQQVDSISYCVRVPTGIKYTRLDCIYDIVRSRDNNRKFYAPRDVNTSRFRCLIIIIPKKNVH